jgi:hypothetical protein
MMRFEESLSGGAVDHDVVDPCTRTRAFPPVVLEPAVTIDEQRVPSAFNALWPQAFVLLCSTIFPFASKQIANLNVGESAESPPDDGVASGA